MCEIRGELALHSVLYRASTRLAERMGASTHAGGMDAGWMHGRMDEWMDGCWLTGCLIFRLAGWMNGWLAGSQVRCLSLAGGKLASLPVGQLALAY